MKKGEKQILIKSNVKINKKSEKLTKDEKEELEDLCQQIHIAMWESKKIPYCEIPSVLLQMKFLRIISRIRILRHRAGESTICA